MTVPDVSSPMSELTLERTDDDREIVFSEDEEAALLVALLRWRGPDV